jgi:Flp pilus assembly protein protease CpaA
MSNPLFFYFLITGVALLRNTIKDMQTRKVDDRFNFSAIGSTLMLLYYTHPTLKLLLVLMLTSIIFMWLLSKYFGSGDLKALAWIFYGLGTIDFTALLFFLVILTLLFIFARFAKNVIIRDPTITIPQN